jgi:N6-adenosine-specific RNA methylase IME4
MSDTSFHDIAHEDGEAVLIAQAQKLLAQGKSQRAVATEIGKPRIWVRGLPKPISAPAIVEVEPRTAVEYVEKITSSFHQSVRSIIETGTWIARAKAALPHGEFGEMIKSQLPFRASTAQRLMAIAGDARLSNPAHVQHLPPHWGTLYELTRLDDDVFQQQLDDGKIRPDMTRGDVMAVFKEERRAAHAARTMNGGTIENLHHLASFGFKASAILADPPWKFVTRSERGEGRSANQHYRTEGLDLIKQLPVERLAADDCTLFMWMPDWFVQGALEVVEAWGFKHKTTGFTWAKLNESGEGWHMGNGYWTRANPEVCWLCTRGNPKRLYEDVRQLIVLQSWSTPGSLTRHTNGSSGSSKAPTWNCTPVESGRAGSAGAMSCPSRCPCHHTIPARSSRLCLRRP